MHYLLDILSTAIPSQISFMTSYESNSGPRHMHLLSRCHRVSLRRTGTLTIDSFGYMRREVCRIRRGGGVNVRQLSDSIIWVFRGEFRGVSEAWSASFLISIHGARTGFATTQSLCSEIRRGGVDFAKDCKHMPPLASQSWCSTVIVHQISPLWGTSQATTSNSTSVARLLCHRAHLVVLTAFSCILGN